MIFRRALIRLTLTYTVVQLVIFGIFALGVYSFVTGAFDFDAVNLEGESSLDAEQSFANLRLGLITGYAILIVFLPISSYVMARGALAPVKRSYELQQHFVDAASHEFRTPLSVIQGELELALSRLRTSTEYREAMSRALGAAEGLSQLTSDLLLLTRENTDELEATFTTVPLTALAHTIVESQDASARQIVVISDLEVGAWGSAELLTRAISNLVENAVKFTSETGRITITVSSTGKVAQVAVSDDGVGMTIDETAHAFDRFWRAESSRTTVGFGLGLALVQQIVAAHHGRLSIDSIVAGGTTLTVSLPEGQP